MTLQAFDKGLKGELRTKLALEHSLDDKHYHIFNNIIIPSGSITTQIDHVIVSKYGLFVVETKNKGGWIFGSPGDDRWTQVSYRKKFHFQNPLRQNYLHTKSIAEFLGIDHHSIYSIIIFSRTCRFRTEMPENVLKKDYIKYVKSKKQILFSDCEVKTICDKLLDLQYNTPAFAGRHHAQLLNKLYSSNTTCPKCGGKLVQRISHSRKGIGQTFLGCKNYPRCCYTKEL